ncbi:MAG: sensor histidine kinase N-terminal domain-containing protein [Zoogloea sp.]|uniref:sensor histidine kinase n=1 Tax=Zoogloea sp. TaxID=49181 RepID=UPI003F368B1D|nr:sensor histidine kinase N-terminal domain-containing protein [Rhodocyclales bacterium]
MWAARGRRNADAARSEGGEGKAFNSLFGEILDWMLAPLLFLWPISIIVTHNVANSIANQPYDQALAVNVKAIARLVTLENGRPRVNFPEPARLILRADEDDTVYYQVRGFKGELLAGDKEIPNATPPDTVVPDLVQFRDETIADEEVRVAYQILQPIASQPSRLVLVQVAETRNKRSTLASRVVTGVLLPQFAIIPIAVILVWMGLSRGIAPLNRLQSLIRRRRPSDLSPIEVGGVPEEVRPLIIAFNEMMARLEENLQAQQRFIADAAHQMRTPLTGLRMQTDLALMESDPAQIHRSLQQISQSAERASHLINQLLSLARAEASYEKIYAVEQVDLEALLRPMLTDFVPRALQKGIDFGLETTDQPLLIDGNPVLLGELLKNLIDNALKYTPVGGCVTVRTIATEKAIVEVEDTGVGIPEADRERVFERFYRVLGSAESGSGLGLPIVREIAELHRAKVSLSPNPAGQGTIVQVVFPFSRTEPPPPALPGPMARNQFPPA